MNTGLTSSTGSVADVVHQLWEHASPLLREYHVEHARLIREAREHRVQDDMEVGQGQADSDSGDEESDEEMSEESKDDKEASEDEEAGKDEEMSVHPVNELEGNRNVLAVKELTDLLFAEDGDSYTRHEVQDLQNISFQWYWPSGSVLFTINNYAYHSPYATMYGTPPRCRLFARPVFRIKFHLAYGAQIDTSSRYAKPTKRLVRE